jgi:hypothetical protein
VHRLGLGAMRLTGDPVEGHPDGDELEVLGSMR